jgi:hypothetical protein
VFFCLPVSLVSTRSSTHCVSEAQKNQKYGKLFPVIELRWPDRNDNLCGNPVISMYLGNVRIWTPPLVASTPFDGDEVRLLTYIGL